MKSESACPGVSFFLFSFCLSGSEFAASIFVVIVIVIVIIVQLFRWKRLFLLQQQLGCVVPLYQQGSQ